jgi:hypothetical protein
MEKISAWALDKAEDITRAPMFGKSLPLEDDTSYRR